MDKTINYALGNLTNYNNSYIFNDSKINKEINNDKEKNNLIQNFNNYFKNNSSSNIINNININIKRYSTIEKVKSKGKLVSKSFKINQKIKNDKKIHDFLYHNINSILSLEIVISESKGLVYTKCPNGNVNKYKFNEFYNRFRAIPELSEPLTCFICQEKNILNNYFCGKCYNFLCHNCMERHEKDFGHQIVSIQNINTFCPIHNKKYISFCYDCNKNCCESCHSSKNKNHNFKTFKDILNDFKKEEKSIVYIKNEINNQLRILDEFITRYKEDLKMIENNNKIESNNLFINNSI